MGETAKIRVQVDVVKLEVNDNGDTISLPVADSNFIKRLYGFTDSVAEKSKEFDDLDTKDIALFVDKNVEFTTYLHDEFNKLFGDNSYEKVFGADLIVGADYVLDFLEQVLPYIEKYTKARQAKLNKYNANRVGSSL